MQCLNETYSVRREYVVGIIDVGDGRTEVRYTARVWHVQPTAIGFVYAKVSAVRRPQQQDPMAYTRIYRFHSKPNEGIEPASIRSSLAEPPL